ncbi:hypothetical protein [Dactylosporangium sp. NPDC051541]|uniref:hypothetical protein n=1 Tax=Dactylosporangium sp. NPDC051541 TaxID=3363977 RepID=UPI0037B85ED2
MTAYDDYLRAIGDLAALPARTEQQAEAEAQRRRRELERVRAEAQAATARHDRLRREVDRQLETARSALPAAHRARLLPSPLTPDRVERATDQDVTEAVRALQVSVADLVTVASRPVAAPPAPPAPDRGGNRHTWPVVAGVLVVVALIVIALIIR